MDILRIATAGSIDDGKSTLIGQLLFETGSVPPDRLDAVRVAGARRGLTGLDLSWLTDGLIAERDQGITVDVAHVYFQTPRRKYIVADTPGHVEYTRNMITGASTAAASIVLVDVRAGLVEQTYRHCFIAALLRIPTLIVAVNKMDLVDWARAPFDALASEIQRVAADGRQGLPPPILVPVSALHGDNVVQRSPRISWYDGPSLLEILERSDTRAHRSALGRLHIQTVLRGPAADRAYAGRISNGAFAAGDEIVVLPGERRSTITRIERLGAIVPRAQAGESVSIRLSGFVDVSRGALIARPGEAPPGRTEITARVCWMGELPLAPGAAYGLQHGSRVVRCRVAQVHGVIDVVTRETRPAKTLSMNDIGRVVVQTSQPLFADAFSASPPTGAFILIDEQTHRTVAAGFVEADEQIEARHDTRGLASRDSAGPAEGSGWPGVA